ncbi:hypothetical protein B0H17DRAFT_1133300 [Mycena rosella]|uniref:Uncharacterized protein n=1 Tax=Mycena rosella TaxID=1033263 RepID=A0AAD7DIW4_MYCRO|nr:hypothetical protein B0H17DRAFT_1133300 [Mycena rosella]
MGYTVPLLSILGFHRSVAVPVANTRLVFGALFWHAQSHTLRALPHPLALLECSGSGEESLGAASASGTACVSALRVLPLFFSGGGGGDGVCGGDGGVHRAGNGERNRSGKGVHGGSGGGVGGKGMRGGSSRERDGSDETQANNERLKSVHYNTHNTNYTNYQARKFGVPTRALNAIPEGKEALQSIRHLPEGSLIFSHLLERSLNLIWHLPKGSLNWSGTFPKEA